MAPNVNFFLGYIPYLKDASQPGPEWLIDKRSFYTCEKDFDFIRYIQEGNHEPTDFIEYSGNRDKSYGIFNAGGLLDKAARKELREKLRTTKSPIWHGLISFEELFGKEYCNSYEQAYELMKTVFPKFLKNADLNPDNITWFASLHTNTDNTHIHFSFFENKPWRYRRRHSELQFSHGQIRPFALNKIKIDVELKLTQWGTRLAGARKEVTTNFKQSLKSYRQGELQKKMTNLLNSLPQSGRLQYDSENIALVRHIIDEITSLVIQTNPLLSDDIKNFFTIAREKDNAITRICKKTGTDSVPFLCFDKYKKDMYRRLGGLVLNTIELIRLEQKRIKDSTGRRAKKRITRSKRKSLFVELVKLNSDFERETKNLFTEFLAKLDEADYNRKVEEGIIE